MRQFTIVLGLLLLVATVSLPGLTAASASGVSRALALKKQCHSVTKVVHGKKKRVKVCKTVKPRPAPTATPSLAQGMRIDIGGYKLYLRCIGEGSPTVVFESGAGNDSDVWSSLLPQVASHTRVCAYDRAGQGLSDPRPSNLPGTGLQIARDLHMLLQAAGVPAPYVLAGHSLGGLLVRLYAWQYRSEVAGLVLIDGIGELDWPPGTVPDFSEVPDWTDTMQELQAATGGVIKGSLGDLPLVVLSQNGELPNCQYCWGPGWDAHQAVYATASTNVIHVKALHSGHEIPSQQPALVVEAVKEVVDAARAPSHVLPACGAAFDQLDGACE